MRRVVRLFLLALLSLSAWVVPVQGRVVRVRTVASLRAAVRDAQAGDTILLRRGVYRLGEPLRIEGKQGLTLAPARPGARVEINGGVRIPRYLIRRVKGFPPGVRRIDAARFSPAAPRTNGHAHPPVPAWSCLYADGRPMHLSEWPDGAFLPLDSVVRTGISIRFDGSGSASTVAPSADVSLLKKASPGAERPIPENGPGFGIIAFREDRPLSWRDPSLGYLIGTFRYGWSHEIVPIKAVGRDKTIEVADTTYYGFGKKPGEEFQKWKVVNIPEEVTRRGEFAIDEATGRIWAMPPRFTRRLELSCLTGSLVQVTGGRDITVRGLSFSCSRGDGVAIDASEGVRVEDCRFHNLGHMAVLVGEDCFRCGVASCDMYDLGAGCVVLGGGDRKAIVRGDNYVEDCVMHDFNLVEKANRPAVKMSGLGNRVSRSEIYNGVAQAIYMGGNDQLVESCDIHHVCQDIEDNGAIYYGRNPSERGSVIRWNHFHDILVPWNVRAVYHDDGACACEVYGNLFDRISSPPVQIGGGSDIRYHDNIFMHLDCAAIKVDGRLQTWGADRLTYHREKVAEVDGPAFRAHYPEFASYYEGDPSRPDRNVLERNLFYQVKWAFEKVVWSDHQYNDVLSGEANFFSEMRDNWKTTINPGFRDPDRPLEGLVPDPPLPDSIPGFVLPPFLR